GRISRIVAAFGEDAFIDPETQREVLAVADHESRRILRFPPGDFLRRLRQGRPRKRRAGEAEPLADHAPAAELRLHGGSLALSLSDRVLMIKGPLSRIFRFIAFKRFNQSSLFGCNIQSPLFADLATDFYAHIVFEPGLQFCELASE